MTRAPILQDLVFLRKDSDGFVFRPQDLNKILNCGRSNEEILSIIDVLLSHGFREGKYIVPIVVNQMSRDSKALEKELAVFKRYGVTDHFAFSEIFCYHKDTSQPLAYAAAIDKLRRSRPDFIVKDSWVREAIVSPGSLENVFLDFI